jgi:hypothetical protein
MMNLGAAGVLLADAATVVILVLGVFAGVNHQLGMIAVFNFFGAG